MPARRTALAAALVAVAGGLGTLAVSSRARAEEPEAAGDRKADARAHFLTAKALADEGNWSPALAEFLRSRQLYPTWGNTLGAATSMKKLGRFDESLDLFERLLKEFFTAMPEEFKTGAQRELIELRGLVGTVEIEGAELGASIVIDGRDRGDYPTPEPLRVGAGSHIVRVSKSGFLPFEARVDVAGRQSARVPTRLLPLARSGRLHVAAEGGRALSVIIDGDVVGTSPWEGALAAGDHVVVLRGEGDVGTQPVSVPVQLDRTASLTLAAEPLAAEIRVEPVPVSATVAIDSVVVGRGIWEGRLRKGRHTIEVAGAGFLAGAREVDLPSGGRLAVAMTLQRDPASPFWRKPPRPAHFFVELTGAPLVVPSFAGDVVGSCSGACTAYPGLGIQTALRGGYELGSGFDVGLGLGYFFAAQTASGRVASLKPVGASGADQGTLEDTIAVHRGGLAGAFLGFTIGDRFPVHLGVGGGMAFATVTDTRSGAFTPQDAGPELHVGPVTLSSLTFFGYAAPEGRLGIRLGDHLELSAGIDALILVPLSRPSWPAGQPVNAGVDGIGTFPAESLLARAVFSVAPGLGLRYDF